MYKLELILNPNAKNNYFSKWLSLNYSPNYKGNAEGSKLFVFFESEPDEEVKTEILNFYNLITIEDSIDMLADEIFKKHNRMQYGLILYDVVSSMIRLARLKIDGSLTSHKFQRELTYDNFSKLQNNIEHGNFISAYEDVETLTTDMGVTADEIIEYRVVISTYLVSNDGQFIDVFGHKVEGGQYIELKGKSIDALGYIIE
tara:strand:+ start:11103 stop:11705 length:603 start_codon:yes stop_codon:yes gene_type:complete